MTSVTLTVRDVDPLVPVTVSRYVPRPTLNRVAIDSVDVDVVGFGLNVAVLRLGRVVLSDTDPAKPFRLFTVIAYVAVPPREIVRDVGVAVSVKSGAGACTTSCTAVVC